MPSQKSIKTPPYTIEICYLEEANKPHYQDLIVLKKGGKIVAQVKTKISSTIGRISDLVLEKSSADFAAISYAAGEFCNALVVFNLKTEEVAAAHGCWSHSDRCHVTELADCRAIVECQDKGAEGKPPARKEPLRQSLSLCHQ